MGSSTIFADESGDESAREERTDDRPRSVFRRRHDDAGRPNRADGDRTDDDAGRPNRADDDRTADDADASERGGPDGPDVGTADRRDRDGRETDAEATMTVFSGDEVYEVSVDDRE